MKPPTEPTQFLSRFLLFTIPLLALWTVAAFWFMPQVGPPLLPYEVLYEYQSAKIEKEESATTLFIGCSSLGNALNAELFSTLSGKAVLSTPLNGMFGYAGSYNMLKYVHSRNKALEEVVLVCTLDMPNRPIAYQGYLYSMTNLSDLQELYMAEVFHTIASSYNIRAQIRRTAKNLWLQINGESMVGVSTLTQLDYYPQSENRAMTAGIPPLTPIWASRNRWKFLKKIISYCENNQLKLTYCNGPYAADVVSRSRDYISRVRKELMQLGLSRPIEPLEIPGRDLGDSLDHVHPNMKDTYTRLIAERLNSNLSELKNSE